MTGLGIGGFFLPNFLAPTKKFPILYQLMPKQKSHSGAKKRVRKTGSGKIVMKRNSRNHLLQQKSKRQKRLNRAMSVGKPEHKKLKALLPSL